MGESRDIHSEPHIPPGHVGSDVIPYINRVGELKLTAYSSPLYILSIPPFLLGLPTHLSPYLPYCRLSSYPSWIDQLGSKRGNHHHA